MLEGKARRVRHTHHPPAGGRHKSASIYAECKNFTGEHILKSLPDVYYTSPPDAPMPEGKAKTLCVIRTALKL